MMTLCYSLAYVSNTVITPRRFIVKTLYAALLLMLLVSGCSLSKGVVKDVHADAAGNLVMDKCDITYIALYTMISPKEN